MAMVLKWQINKDFIMKNKNNKSKWCKPYCCLREGGLVNQLYPVYQTLQGQSMNFHLTFDCMTKKNLLSYLTRMG